MYLILNVLIRGKYLNVEKRVKRVRKKLGQYLNGTGLFGLFNCVQCSCPSSEMEAEILEV